jgi:hypothetical protein
MSIDWPTTFLGKLEKRYEDQNNPCGSAAGIGGSVCVNYLCPVEAGGGGMTKDEALDLALKTLRSAAGELYRVTSYCDTYDALAETNNAIIDIQQARLAHMQKRPQNCGTGFCSCIECVMEPAPVQEPVAQLGDGVLWCDTCRSVTASTHHSNPNDRDVWCEGEAKWLQGPFYTTPPAQPAVPDAIGPDEDELPAYAAGWNDCRAEMLREMKP